LEACKQLASADTTRRFQTVINSTRELTHDQGQSRWYSSVLVRWEFLSRLDDRLALVKSAQIDAGGPHQEEAPDRPTEAGEVPDDVKELLGQLNDLSAGEQSYVLRAHLLLYAQAYHSLVEAVATSSVGWVDMELNGWYLGVINNIRRLLAMPEFSGFPGGFEPIADHLFPSSDLDIGWEDCIGPSVMDFLARAQAFVAECDSVRPDKREFVASLLSVCREKCSQ